jgi:uncharacterized membrane protein YvbJ
VSAYIFVYFIIVYFVYCSSNSSSSRSLVKACSSGDVKTVEKMLSEGKGNVHETTEEGESLLSLACSAGYVELAQVGSSN